MSRQENKRIMNSASFIFDVRTRDFANRVIKASMEKPVLVDFWADWCAPCKMLGPLLENVVASYGGKVLLAKVNVDENRELASQLGIQSIPTVKIFLNGEIADEFTGAITENEIRGIIDSLTVSDTEELLAYADKLIEQEQFDEAESVYATILETAPDNSTARIGLARLKILKGEDAAAEKLLNDIPETDSRYQEAQSLLGLFEFVKISEENGGLEKWTEAVEKNPEDLEARYMLGCCHAANSSFREAFELFFSIFKKDRKFGDGKARQAMLTLFTVLGPANELTEEYRRKLAMELF